MHSTKILLFFLVLGTFSPQMSFSAVLPHNTTITVPVNPTPQRLSVRSLWKSVKNKKPINRFMVVVGCVFVAIAILAFILVASIARSSKNTAAPASSVGNEGNAMAGVVFLTGGLLSLVCGAVFLIDGLDTSPPRNEQVKKVEKVEKVEKTKEEKQKSTRKTLKVLGIIALVVVLKMLLSLGV